jgi:hypothetical protein
MKGSQQSSGVFPSHSQSPSHTSGHTKEVASTSDMQSLTEYTNSLLFHGLAKSTRKTYSVSDSQRRFLEFCYWSGLIHDNGSPLPCKRTNFLIFTAHLSRTIKASSTKVYLSGVRSLHIEQGFKNPLENCVRLERVLCGVKRYRGLGPSSACLSL